MVKATVCNVTNGTFGLTIQLCTCKLCFVFCHLVVFIKGIQFKTGGEGGQRESIHHAGEALSENMGSLLKSYQSCIQVHLPPPRGNNHFLE